MKELKYTNDTTKFQKIWIIHLLTDLHYVYLKVHENTLYSTLSSPRYTLPKNNLLKNAKRRNVSLEFAAPGGEIRAAIVRLAFRASPAAHLKFPIPENEFFSPVSFFQERNAKRTKNRGREGEVPLSAEEISRRISAKKLR